MNQILGKAAMKLENLILKLRGNRRAQGLAPLLISFISLVRRLINGNNFF